MVDEQVDETESWAPLPCTTCCAEGGESERTSADDGDAESEEGAGDAEGEAGLA